MWDDFEINPQLTNLLVVLIVALITGANSIAARIRSGQKFTFISIICEVSMSVLVAYIVYDAYPAIDPYIWDGFTVWMLVAVGAHMGTRLVQMGESFIDKHYSKFINKQ